MPFSEKLAKPRIAITMGDPCGVGPEILVKALASGAPDEWCDPLVIGDPLALERANRLLEAGLKIHTLENVAELESIESLGPGRQGVVCVLAPRKLDADDLVYGHPTKAACGAVVAYIELAARLAMAGEARAVCTCPINKAQLHRHGFSFPGHTEFLKELTHADEVVMMLAGPMLKVSLVTIHHAVSEVPGLITRDRLLTTIRITGEALMKDFGLDAPRIAVAALNPHAGEEGRFGREELDLIGPALESLQESRFHVSGPFPPDTLFYRAFSGEFDAVVAMYHDQGLIPIKLVHFHEAVNVSLGLPIIRASVDHGTAYDLAGTGKARPGSLLAAIHLAAQMAHNRFGRSGASV